MVVFGLVEGVQFQVVFGFVVDYCGEVVLGWVEVGECVVLVYFVEFGGQCWWGDCIIDFLVGVVVGFVEVGDYECVFVQFWVVQC